MEKDRFKSLKLKLFTYRLNPTLKHERIQFFILLYKNEMARDEFRNIPGSFRVRRRTITKTLGSK